MSVVWCVQSEISRRMVSHIVSDSQPSFWKRQWDWEIIAGCSAYVWFHLLHILLKAFNMKSTASSGPLQSIRILLNIWRNHNVDHGSLEFESWEWICAARKISWQILQSRAVGFISMSLSRYNLHEYLFYNLAKRSGDLQNSWTVFIRKAVKLVFVQI